MILFVISFVLMYVLFFDNMESTKIHVSKEVIGPGTFLIMVTTDAFVSNDNSLSLTYSHLKYIMIIHLRQLAYTWLFTEFLCACLVGRINVLIFCQILVVTNILPTKIYIIYSLIEFFKWHPCNFVKMV